MSTITYKYWVYLDHLTGLIEDWSLIPNPLPEGWAVYDSDTLLPGYPDEYTLENGQLTRRPPPPPPNALQKAMCPDPTILAALDIIRSVSPVAALMSQLIMAHIEQNLQVAETALAALSTEVSNHQHT